MRSKTVFGETYYQGVRRKLRYRNFGTPLLFETLVEFGLGEVAYHMITSVTYPSYGYMITNGATTLWEYWEKEYGFYQCPANHNQPMFGSISSFFYEKLAGIKPLKPAYKKIEINAGK